MLCYGGGFDSTVYPLSFDGGLYTEKWNSWFLGELFSFANNHAVHIVDLNNDGFLDIVTSYGISPPYYRYCLGNQNGFGSLGTFNITPDYQFSDPSVIFMDFTNDGMVGITYANGSTAQFYRNVSSTYFAPGVLQSITDELGKTTTFTLVNSYEMTQNSIPFRFPILKKIEEKDGYSPDRSFTYEYFNPKYDRLEREFQGFGRVRETDINARWIDTYFRQDRPHLGFGDRT